jgi:hypothetical protein
MALVIRFNLKEALRITSKDGSSMVIYKSHSDGSSVNASKIVFKDDGHNFLIERFPILRDKDGKANEQSIAGILAAPHAVRTPKDAPL